MTVLAGKDAFRSDLSSWAVLAASALSDVSYTPDFTAYISGGPLRCLHFTREHFSKVVDASAIERRDQLKDGDKDVDSVVEAASQIETSSSRHLVIDIERGRDSSVRKDKFMAALQIGGKRSTRFSYSRSVSPNRDRSRSFRKKRGRFPMEGSVSAKSLHSVGESLGSEQDEREE